MAHGGPIQTPYVYDSGGDFAGLHITITINFNNATRALTGAVIHRDPGCQYTKIYVGLGPDGTPDSGTHTFNVGQLNGDRSFSAAQLLAVGFSTIEDVLALGQITAGP